MTINFYLRFHTEVGQELSIRGDIDELGNNFPDRMTPMQYMNSEFWHASIQVNPEKGIHIKYSYVLTYGNGDQVFDGEHQREIESLNTALQELNAIDTWNYEGAYENTFFTSPFQQILLPRYEGKTKIKTPKTFSHTFKVKAPPIKEE